MLCLLSPFELEGSSRLVCISF